MSKDTVAEPKPKKKAAAPSDSKGAKKEVIKESEVGTHKVYLRRKPVLGHLPKEIRADAKVRLGAVFHNRQPLRAFPVDSPEEKKYLKGLLDVGPEDPTWAKEVRKFWLEQRINVPFEGKELEIGVDLDGEPLNIMDWVIYCFAKKHFMVADTEEEMMSSAKMRFFIQDPRKEVKRKNTTVQLGKLADREFIKASDSPVRMKNLLRVLSTINNVSKLDEETVENMLFDIKNNTPGKFLKMATDEDLDVRAEIAAFVEAGVLQKVGNSYINMDETIGADIDETIRTMKNPGNSGMLNTLRVKYREITR